MDSSLLVSESVFLKIPNEDSHESINFHDSIEDLREELKSLSWDQLIELENDDGLSCTSETTGPVCMTKSEALKLLNIAATLLQRNIRRYFQQQKYQEFLKVYKAAVKIQTAWRGYRTRNLDVRVLQLKHDFIVSKLQNKIEQMDDHYKREVDYLHEDKQLMTQIISLLYKEIESLKPKLATVSTSYDSEPLTPNNDQETFFVNNPHLNPIDSGVSISSITTVVLGVDSVSHTQAISAKENIKVSCYDKCNSQEKIKDQVDAPQIDKSEELSILSFANDSMSSIRNELSENISEIPERSMENISLQNPHRCKKIIEKIKNEFNSEENVGENEICNSHTSSTKDKFSGDVISMEESATLNNPTEQTKGESSDDEKFDLINEPNLAFDKDNVKNVSFEKECGDLSKSNNTKASPLNTEASMSTPKEIEDVLTFVETSRDDNTISLTQTNIVITEINAHNKEEESNYLFHKELIKSNNQTVALSPANDENAEEFLNPIQADSVEFVNDSLQVDDSYNDDKDFPHVNNVENMFSVNVVVNGQAVQPDSIPINPIEADSLQFITDSLQVD